jgi:hypothetical protein
MTPSDGLLLYTAVYRFSSMDQVVIQPVLAVQAYVLTPVRGPSASRSSHEPRVFEADRSANRLIA